MWPKNKPFIRVALQLISLTGLLFVMNGLEINPVVREMYRNTLMYLGSVIILANKPQIRSYLYQQLQTATLNLSQCLGQSGLMQKMNAICSGRRVAPATTRNDIISIDA